MTVAGAVNDLLAELVRWNTAADKAIAAYEARNAELRLEAGANNRGRLHVLKRDDVRLAEIGSRAAFATATATRVAATLQTALLVEVLQRMGGRG